MIVSTPLSSSGTHSPDRFDRIRSRFVSTARVRIR